MDLKVKIHGLISKFLPETCLNVTAGSKNWTRVAVDDEDHVPICHGIVEVRDVTPEDTTSGGLHLTQTSFHGRVLKSEIVPESDDEALIKFFRRLENARLCSGIETDLNQTNHRTSLRDFAANYLLDPHKDRVVLRSRNCLYDVNLDSQGDRGACHECQSAQQKLEESPPADDEAYYQDSALDIKYNGTNDLSAFLEESMEVDDACYYPEELEEEPEAGSQPPAFNQTCRICLKTYDDDERFVNDQTNHHSQFSNLDEPVKCPLCQTTVDTKWDLNDHMTAAHDEMRGNGCCVECILIMPQRLLRTHIMKKHIVKRHLCQQCGQIFNSPNELNVSFIFKSLDMPVFIAISCFSYTWLANTKPRGITFAKFAG